MPEPRFSRSVEEEMARIEGLIKQVVAEVLGDGKLFEEGKTIASREPDLQQKPSL